MKCANCNLDDCHDVITVDRRFTDAKTGRFKYKTSVVYTICLNCGEMSNYAHSGPLDVRNKPLDQCNWKDEHYV